MKNGLRFKWKSNSSRSLESRFEFELFTSERNLLQDWNTPTSTQPAPSSTPEERNYYLKYMIIIITKTSRRDGVGIWWKNKFVEKTKLNFLETQYWCLESPTEKQQMFFSSWHFQQNHFQKYWYLTNRNFPHSKITNWENKTLRSIVKWNRGKMHLQEEIVQLAMFPDLERAQMLTLNIENCST